jgi:hypothetical protein
MPIKPRLSSRDSFPTDASSRCETNETFRYQSNVMGILRDAATYQEKTNRYNRPSGHGYRSSCPRGAYPACCNACIRHLECTSSSSVSLHSQIAASAYFDLQDRAWKTRPDMSHLLSVLCSLCIESAISTATRLTLVLDVRNFFVWFTLR